MNYYILVGRTPVLTSLLKFELWFEIANRCVSTTKIDDMEVSTVFLGLDHNFNLSGPPLLFETMIFGNPIDHDYQKRCSTWEQALHMHEEGCAYARKVIAEQAPILPPERP